MNIKVLCIAIALLTVIIFGANHYAAQNPPGPATCDHCDCTVRVVSVFGKTEVKEPSCSVVFAGMRPIPLYGKVRRYEFISEAAIRDAISVLCSWAVFCDPTYSAKVECKDTGQEFWIVNPSEKCTFTCTKTDWEHPCDHWVRPTPTPTPTPKPTPKPTPPKNRKRPRLLDTSSSMFITPNNLYESFMTNLLPASYDPQPIDNNEGRNIISRSTQWRPNGAEAGIENGMLMVASGEAEARSFCTGDTIRLAGPDTVTLPSCDFDVSGSWWGAYGRRKGFEYEPQPVNVSLKLRKEASSLRGELTTPDGLYDVVSISQSSSALELQATRSTAAGQQKIMLRGRVTKGEIILVGSEQSPANNKTYDLTGVLKRLYVADNALPAAALNQPYSFSIVALSPTGNPVNFRLVNPAPKQPKQIAWDTEAQSLRGRNGERFTYLCPENGSLGRLYSRDNAYTDTSSICTAAVNAHVITQAAGGVVTIEIRPGPSPDTGRFVFVKTEPQGGVSGRLPQGLLFDSQSGTFSGTPTELGSFEIGVVADDGTGNTFEQPLTLTVKRMVLTNAWLADAFVGQHYKTVLQVGGGAPPYRFSGNIPRGLQLDPNTGELSGTPNATGSGFDVTVRDSQNSSETLKLIFRVRSTTIVNSFFLPDAELGTPYRMQFQAVGSPTAISWEVGKDDPSFVGLTLNGSTGELSGTPTKAGTLVFEVRAQGSSNSARQFALTVKPKPGSKPR